MSGAASLPPLLTPPALGVPRSGGLVCIACPYDPVLVSNKTSGPSEIDLELVIAVDGSVSDVSVAKTPTPELGATLAEEARSWVFEPYVKEGTAVQARTVIKLHIQVIKSY
jgi:hypothetical protein